jgi:hypothetical protein
MVLPHQYEVVKLWICSEGVFCLLKESEVFIAKEKITEEMMIKDT